MSFPLVFSMSLLSILVALNSCFSYPSASASYLFLLHFIHFGCPFLANELPICYRKCFLCLHLFQVCIGENNGTAIMVSFQWLFLYLCSMGFWMWGTDSVEIVSTCLHHAAVLQSCCLESQFDLAQSFHKFNIWTPLHSWLVFLPNEFPVCYLMCLFFYTSLFYSKK